MGRTVKSLEVWKRQAADFAGSLMARGDMFSSSDPYHVLDLAEIAFEDEEKPRDFVRRVFADDIEALATIVDESEDFYGERL